MPDLFSGSLSGRFFTCAKVAPGTDVRSLVVGDSWTRSEQDGAPRRLQRGWCRSEQPHDGNLEVERDLLGYVDRGTGLWRLWLREDERKVGKAAVDAAAVSMASTAGIDLSRARADVRARFSAEATLALMRRAIPSIRVFQVVLSADGWGWFGDRVGVEHDRAVLLRRACGGLLHDPLCWRETAGFGWSSLSLAALRAVLRSLGDDGAGLAIDDGISLIEVRATGRCIRCSASDDGHDRERLRGMVEALVADPSMKVTQLCFAVRRGHEVVELALDDRGVYCAWPPASSGGLPAERIARRFRDVRQSASALGVSLAAAARCAMTR